MILKGDSNVCFNLPHCISILSWSNRRGISHKRKDLLMEVSDEFWELTLKLGEELMSSWPNGNSVLYEWLREIGKLPPDPRGVDKHEGRY